MKHVLSLMILSSAVVCAKVSAQDSAIFPKGEISTTDNHTGTISLNELNKPDSIFNYSIGVATHAAGAKLDWHIHAGGQTLLITEGTGYYQEKGKGDVVKCPRGVTHWHGASPGCEFAHLVVAPDAEKGEVTWLQKVTEEEYNGLK